MTLELTDRELDIIADALECLYDHTVDSEEAEEIADIFNKVKGTRSYDL